MSEDEVQERLAEERELLAYAQVWDDEKPWPAPRRDPAREPSHPWARIGIDEK
jgi:hypothetical protein